MNNTSREDFETLSKEVNKRIHTCKDCGGEGRKGESFNKSCKLPEYVDCTTCQGDGYVIPKHLHSLICNENSFSKEPCNCDGYTLTLQDILLALHQSKHQADCDFHFQDNMLKCYIDGTGATLWFDLTKTHQEWDDETIEEIIKLIK